LDDLEDPSSALVQPKPWELCRKVGGVVTEREELLVRAAVGVEMVEE
jgi:hypothetical protein